MRSLCSVILFLAACGGTGGSASDVIDAGVDVASGDVSPPITCDGAPAPPQQLALVGTVGEPLEVPWLPLPPTLETPPAHGALMAEGEVVSYRPDPRFVGADRFSWTLDDPCHGAVSITAHLTIYDQADAGAPQVSVEAVALEGGDVAVVVNDADPQSVAVAEAYRAARHLDPTSFVHLSFEPTAVMDPVAFEALHEEALAQASPSAQAWALTFSRPYRVGGMSITSAFALGYDAAYTNTTDEACADTQSVPTYLTTSPRFFEDHGIRPAMMLLGESQEEAMALVARGVDADRTNPVGAAYLVRTDDPARNVRWPQMIAAELDWEEEESLTVHYLDNHDGGLGTNEITDVHDVLFYCTGLTHVDGLETLTFLPGAFADHLTSLGGVLDTDDQMPVSRWLEAGATGSYGTVVEPCNKLAKFPHVRFLIQSVFRGRTLLEAVWTSVHWPGEGLLVGDPLSRPYGKLGLSYEAGTLTLATTWIGPGELWDLEASDDPSGPWESVLSALAVAGLGAIELSIDDATRSHYRLRRRND